MEHEQNPKTQAIGESLFPRVWRKRLGMLERLDPEFKRLFEEYTYAGMYSREVLDQRTRELCAVAALVVRPYPNQLASHIRAALLAGASRQEVQEVLLQMSVYGGFPATLSSLDVMERVYAELDAESGRDQA